tara:strand:+ start:81 stop:563 length:483 start_codon:yes stop_codon:yes gene_type:complete
MSNEKDIRKSLRSIIKGEERPYSVIATVIEVEDTTCDVQLLNSDVILYEVLISIDTNASLEETPVVGSKVVVTFLSYNTAFISMNTMVNDISIVTKDEDGNIIESLKEVLIDTLDFLQTNIEQMTHSTPAGPTVPIPINNASFLKTKTDLIGRINKIFKK